MSLLTDTFHHTVMKIMLQVQHDGCKHSFFFFFPTVFKETNLHFHESQPGQLYLCHNKISLKYVCIFIQMTLRTVMLTSVFQRNSLLIPLLCWTCITHQQEHY